MNKKLFTLTIMAFLAIQALGCLEGQYVDPLTKECLSCDQIENSVPGGDQDLCLCEFGFRFDSKNAKCVGQIDGSIPLNEKKPRDRQSSGLDKKQNESPQTNQKNKPQTSKKGKKPENEPKPTTPQSELPVPSSEEKNLRKRK